MNPYEILFGASLKLSTERRAERGRSAPQVEDHGLMKTLSDLFPQTTDIFTNKLYFARFLRKSPTITSTDQYHAEESRKKHRAAFQQRHKGNDSYQGGMFKLLVELDKAQDDGDKKEVARLVFSIFDQRLSILDPVRELYLSMLQGQTLKDFIQIADDEFLGKETLLLNDLLRRADLSAFNKICDRLNGKMFEIRAKNSTIRSLCFSGFHSFAYGTVGCLGLVFSSSVSSLKGSKVTRVDESIVETGDNNTLVENTTQTSEELLVGYESIVKSFTLIGASLISFGFSLCWGQKFIHDLGLRLNKDVFHYGLQWLALYTIGHRDMFDGSILGRLEDAIEGQWIFFGKGKSKFIKKIVNEIDVYAEKFSVQTSERRG